ncbi:hypothetical protein GCM10010390_78910 [Streptomyces mordarskii]|uniref:Uncharacterized protein n=1 Tax=Streptomyces mordarskii TaxID=1226758 RepID=A0ABN1EER8_9ACTN
MQHAALILAMQAGSAREGGPQLRGHVVLGEMGDRGPVPGRRRAERGRGRRDRPALDDYARTKHITHNHER